MPNNAASNTVDTHRAELPASGSPPVLDTSATQASSAPLASPQDASLVAALTRIQRGDLSGLASGDVALAATLAMPGTTNVLRELRRTSLAGSLGHVDSVTLDIVALLFDQIFAYQNIPPLMRRVIGQLQIPMLKVAILDKTFFYKKTHSARRLFDCLGDIAVSTGADLDAGSPLYGEVQKTVRELLYGFEHGMEIFDRLCESLERCVAEQNRSAVERAEIAAKRIGHKERLSLATAVARQEILHRARSGRVPHAVHRFLAEQWIQVMLIAHAKHGNESEAWSNAVATMDLLIWSVRPKRSLVERRTLAAVLPDLLKRLNAGLRKIGVEAGDRKRFFTELMRCHTEAMNAAPSLHARPADATSSARPMWTSEATAVPALPTLTVPNPFGEGRVEVEEIGLSHLPAAGNPAPVVGRIGPATGGDEYNRMAGSLKEGAWVDFRVDNDDRWRARLFYVSPLRRTYLFVSGQGGNVSEYSLHRLAYELRAGRASIVETMPLFDRVMGSLAGTHGTSTTLQ